MAGRSLREHLAAQSPREELWVQRFAEAAARALTPIHSQGAAHGAVRPESLTVDDSTDFFKVELIADGEAPQAPEPDRYIAPEIGKGEPVAPGTDMFGLGVCLYEAIAGRTPYRVMEAAMVPSNPRDYAPDIDPKFSLAIRHLLAADPAVRLSSASDLMEKLDELQHPEDPPTLTDFAPPTGPQGQALKVGETTDEFYVRMDRETAEYQAVQREQLATAATGGNGDDPFNEADGAAHPDLQPNESTGKIHADGLFVIEDDEDPEAEALSIKKSKAPLIAAIIILLLVAGGVGGWFLYQKQQEDQLRAAIAQHLNSARENLGKKAFDAAGADVGKVLQLDADNADAKSLKDDIAAAKLAEDKRLAEIAKLMNASRKSLSETRYAEARTHANGVFKLEAEHTGAKALLAVIDEAERKAAMAKADAHVKTGRANLESTQFADAEKEADAALKLIDKHAGALKLLDDIAAERAAANALSLKNRIDKMYRQAVDHYKGSRLDPAEKLGLQILALDAKHPGALALLEKIREDRGNLEEFTKYMALARKSVGEFKWQVGVGAVIGAEQIKKNDETAKFRDSSYAVALGKGQEAEQANQYAEAIAHVKGALAFKDDPAGREYLKKLQGALGLAKQGAAFMTAWKAGEAHREKKEWDPALENYNVALKHATDPEPVKERIKEVELERDLASSLAAAKIAYKEGDQNRKARKWKDAQAAYARAIQGYEKALALRADEAVNNRLAQAYRKSGSMNEFLRKGDAAIADYTNAIRVRPDYTVAYNSRGKAYVRASRFEESLKDFSKAVELKPKYAEAWQNRGFANRKLEKFAEAVADYSEAIKLKDDYALVYSNRGAARIELKQIDEALIDLNRAIELNPKDPRAYVNRAYAYLEKGNDLDRVIADCESALKISPNMSQALYYRGRAHDWKGMARTALDDYTRAIEMNPSYVTALAARGRLYLKKGSKKKAEADFKKALEIDPKHEDADELRKLLAE